MIHRQYPPGALYLWQRDDRHLQQSRGQSVHNQAELGMVSPTIGQSWEQFCSKLTAVIKRLLMPAQHPADRLRH